MRRRSRYGSVLGFLLYCITTQRLTDDLERTAPVGAAVEGADLAPTHLAADPFTAPPRLAAVPDVGNPPVYFPQDDSDDEGVNFWDPVEEGGDVADDNGVTLTSFKYIDDTMLFEAAPLNQAVRHVSVNCPTENLTSLKLGPAFCNLSLRSEDIGMRINKNKTQLLVISLRPASMRGTAR